MFTRRSRSDERVIRGRLAPGSRWRWTTGVYFKKHAADVAVVRQYTPTAPSVSTGVFQIMAVTIMPL